MIVVMMLNMDDSDDMVVLNMDDSDDDNGAEYEPPFQVLLPDGQAVQLEGDSHVQEPGSSTPAQDDDHQYRYHSTIPIPILVQCQCQYHSTIPITWAMLVKSWSLRKTFPEPEALRVRFLKIEKNKMKVKAQRK